MIFPFKQIIDNVYTCFICLWWLFGSFKIYLLMFRTFKSDTSNFLKYETQCDSKYPYNDCRNDSLNEIKGTK